MCIVQAHNLFIQIAATTGIVGLIVWLWFIRQLVGRLREMIKKARDSDRLQWMGVYSKSFTVSILALFVAGLFGHNLYRYNWYMMAGLTTAMYALSHSTDTSERETTVSGEGAEVTVGSPR